MFPLRDDVPCNTVPVVNYAIIVICALAYMWQVTAPEGFESTLSEYGMVSGRITGKYPANETLRIDIPSDEEGPQSLIVRPSAVQPWMTLITCIFLHGSFMHILGNMWFLYIFGDNVEDRYGHVGYALLYLGAGIIAGVLQLLSSPGSPIPTIGASGAIAGVMGAYFLLYRHARVITLIPLGIFTQLIAVPAPFFLGLWFVIQFVSAAGTPTGKGGVAFWAHVGGFAAGVLATWLLGFRRQEVHPEVYQPTPAWQRRQYPW